MNGYVDSDRLQERMDALKMSQAELARRVDISQPSIYKLLQGGARTAYLNAIARVLQTSAEYLTGEIDDASPTITGPVTADEFAIELGLVQIEEIDLTLGMGAAFMDEVTVSGETRWIPEEWISAITTSPASVLTIVRPTGDSMYPTINDRDIVFIDKSCNRIDRQDAIWALVYAGFGTIKRVRAMPDGSMKMSGDNPQVRDETAYDGEMYVIGRVVGVLRRT